MISAVQQKLQQLINCYHLDPKAQAKKLLHAAASNFTENPIRSQLGPSAAVFDVVSEHGNIPSRILAKAFHWIFATCFRDIPGWNDYYMVRWLLTHSNEDLKEIAARTERNDIVGDTARWMVASMCNQLPEFEKAAKESPFRFWGVPISQEPQCK